MKKIAKSLSELIGNTPLLELSNFEKEQQAGAHLLAKLESLNPAGSAKDRVGKAMIEDGERKGLLNPGSTIIEPTSGNTGIGLAMVAAARGYKMILTMPDTMSVERRNLLKAYGAEIVLTPGAKGMNGAIQKAEELAKEIPHSFIPGQFVNEANPAIHQATTGPEIWRDTDGQVDILVAGVGTGGTLTGTGRYLKSQNKDVKIVAVEPSKSAVLAGASPAPHGLQGIGAGFIPTIMDVSIVDEIMGVEEQDAYEVGRSVAHCEGLLIGISGGAALWAALQLAKRPENKGKNIVVIVPDTGERYLSTPLFAE